ncbi:MAG: SLC13 family permease [Gammaproteobacteria bacterium]
MTDETIQVRQEDKPLLGRGALAGLAAGALALAFTILVPAPAGLPEAGWRVLGLALLMAVWWSTEPVPMGVTALMPLIVMPLLGIVDLQRAAAAYANPLIFLFLGGFLLAAAIRRWGLHRRMAHAAVRAIGTEPRRLVLGFMAATGFLSMWISNTSAALLMLPVALSIVAAMEEAHGATDQVRRFAQALLLGLAYGASIGGIGTLIGTPPNALLAGYLLERHGIDLSFAAWSAFAMPLAALFLGLGWLALTRVVFRFPAGAAASGDRQTVLRGLGEMGPASAAQRRAALVFAAAAVLWVLRPLLNRVPGLEGLSDAGIALGCAAALFLVPAGSGGERRFLLNWREAQEIPWHVLLLFGGGLSLAAAMDGSGLAAWLGDSLGGLGGLPVPVFLLLLIATVVLLSEVASNTAAVAALLPVVATIAAGAGMDVVTVSVAVTLAASCGFMLPMATPPNALVFATPHVTAAAMMRAGLAMNLIGVALVTLVAWLVLPLLRS